MPNHKHNGQQPNILLGYRRKSMVRNQTDLVSPERQMHTCNLWAEIQDQSYTIEWYEDIDGHRSGRYEKGRPGWQALMQQLARPDVAGVIADSFDRMYRNVHQFLTFLNQLEALNKRLITVKEGLDTSSAMGRAIVTILMVIYQLESDQTSERMTANVRYKREVLGRHWGPTPFGCDRNEEGQLIPTVKTYWLNPATGQTMANNGKTPDGYVQRRYLDGLIALYQVYGQGTHSLEAAAQELNTNGWRYYAENSTGNKPRLFSKDDVRRIVSFWRVYRGELILGNATNDRHAPVIEGGHDPILPIDLCNRVGAAKKLRGREPQQRRKERVYILSNIIYCGVCGCPLKGQFHKGKRWYRHYGGKNGCYEKQVNADDIEHILLEQFSVIANHNIMAEIETHAERIMRRTSAKDNKTKTLLTELDRQNDRLHRLEELYLDSTIDIDRYRRRHAEITTEINELEAKLYSATELADLITVIDRMKQTFSQINAASPETKKALVNSIIQRIDVAGKVPVNFEPRPWAKPFF